MLATERTGVCESIMNGPRLKPGIVASVDASSFRSVGWARWV